MNTMMRNSLIYSLISYCDTMHTDNTYISLPVTLLNILLFNLKHLEVSIRNPIRTCIRTRIWTRIWTRIRTRIRPHIRPRIRTRNSIK